MSDDSVHEHDPMDALLRETMAAPAPTLSPGFDANVLRQVRPRRLTAAGRPVMTLYVIAAVTAIGSLWRDVPLEWIGASVALTLLVAIALARYAQTFADA